MGFRKTSVPGYVKDDRTGVVLNTNVGEYKMILEARRRKLENDTLKARLERFEEYMRSGGKT